VDDGRVSYVPQRAPRFSTVKLRGIAHRIARWGSSDVDPVLLLHGFLDTCETYQFLVDEFPPEWNFIALDWRGFGDSADNSASYWFPDYLADLEALLDLLAPGRALRVVGHSMGGNVAALYAGVRPERIRALVSLEGFGLPRVPTDTAPQRYGKWLDQLRGTPLRARYESVERFAAVLRVRNSRLTNSRSLFLAAAWTRPCTAGQSSALSTR
jgi:pimeloyl-ACP methyl ester carboxylesterase